MPLQPFVGQIMPAGFGLTPKGWAPCNGQLLPIAQNQALFSLLGTVYGGDGVRTFQLPDLRGRAVMGSNFGSVSQGEIAGSEKVTMTVDQVPAHTHAMQASTNAGSGRGGGPTNKVFGVNTTAGETIFADAGSNEVALAVRTNIIPEGSSQPHNNMQPYLVISYLIALVGVFPSRN